MREGWVTKNHEVKRLTREAKTRVWRKNLNGIVEKKDVAGAWQVVMRPAVSSFTKAGVPLTLQKQMPLTRNTQR